MKALHGWLQDQVKRVSGPSDMAKAMRYAIRHWPGLVVFLDDGQVEMDNNVVERAIRPSTLTRTNALFAGSDGGAELSSAGFCLVVATSSIGIRLTTVSAHDRHFAGTLMFALALSTLLSIF